MSDVGLARFQSALRIMQSLTRRDVVAGGVIAADDGTIWHSFRSNPAAFMARCDQQTAARLWRLIEVRQIPEPASGA